MKDKKRLLTEKEINNIVSFVTPQKNIPSPVAHSIVTIIKNKLKEQLKTQKIYPILIPKLKKELQDAYERSKIHAGESVGIIAAQSIGEKQTQSSLNNFHKAGSGENYVGSKFSELLNASKNPKVQNSFVYFKSGNDSVDELRHTIGSSLVEITIKKVTKSFRIVLDKEDEDWYAAYSILYDDAFRQYTDCISLTIDTDILFTYKLTMQDIAETLSGNYDDLECVYSPDNIGQLDVFIDTRTINLPEDRLVFIDQDNVKEIYLEEVVQPKLEQILISGIKGVKQMFFNKDAENKDKWMIETEGSNFKKILGHPMVDTIRTVSSNIWEIYNTLGVEAVRQFLIEQFSKSMPDVVLCHVMLLVDKMTFKGSISSITRYTMKKEDRGPFSKASFEETLSNFLNAGIYGQEEPVKGVSASIICGKVPNIGSGLTKLSFNTDMIKEN